MSNNIHPSRIFKTPAELEEAWAKYKENLREQANEWLRIQYVGKEGERVADPQKVPMTYEGFKRFCYDNYGQVNQYFENQHGYYDDFMEVCSRIKDEIRENQIVGGLLGFYNPSITQRLNGLTEKVETDNTHKGKIEITLDLNK
jgi:hypothetical protein